MKTLFTVLWVVSAFARGSQGHELPMFGAVPKLGDEWRVRERETQVPQFNGTLRVSYLVLTNAKTGDLLSFCAEKLNEKPFPKANRVPWSDMASARFPGGYTTWQQPKDYKPVVYWLRNEVIDVSVVDTNRNTNYKEQALEYTIIFEEKSGPSRLAHGYMIPMGEYRIQVQHTSTNVVTSEFAHSMISAMLWDFVNGKRAVKAAD